MHHVVGFLSLALAVVPHTLGDNITLFNWQPICEGSERTCDWPAGRSLTFGAKLMVEHINEVGFLHGGHQLRLVVEDTACAQEAGLEKVAKLLLLPPEERPFGVIGCGCSTCTMIAAPVLSIARVPIISHTSTNSALADRAAFPNLFRMTPPDMPAIEALVDLFQSWGWKQLGMVADEDLLEGHLTSWRVIMTRKGMVDVFDGQQSRVLKDHGEEQITAAVRGIVRQKVRGLIMLAFVNGAVAMACGISKMKIHGLVVGHFGWFLSNWVTGNLDHVTCTAAEMEAVTELFINANPPFWNSPSTPAPCSNGMYTVEDFRNEYNARRLAAGVEWRTETSATADSICMMAKLINVLLDEGRSLEEISAMDNATFARAVELMQRTRFEGISGLITFPADGSSRGGGDRVSPLYLHQRVNGSLNEVGIVQPFERPSFFPGKRLLFEGGFTQENPPPELFPSCDVGQVYDFISGQCIGCAENLVFIQAADACLSVPGYFAEPNGNATPCSPGNYSSSAGAQLCDECEVGKYSTEGASGCTFCAKGTFTPNRSSANCTSCASVKPRTTTLRIASTTQADCVCEEGTYQTADGTCRVCPDGSSTSDADKKSVSACLCQEGTYMPKDGSVCQPCPVGMKCVLGSSEANFLSRPARPGRDGEEEKVPFLLPGFYSSEDHGFLSVFSCQDDKRCMGGDPVFGTCSPHSYGLACEHCEVEHFWNGNACVACDDMHGSQVFFPVLPCLLVPIMTVLLYYLKWKEVLAVRWNTVGNTRNALAFIVLNHFQVLDLTRGASLDLPLRINDAMGVFSWTTDAGSLFRMQCTIYNSFQLTMVVKSLAPIVITSIMVGVYAVSATLAKLSRRQGMALSADRLFNVWGTIMFSFFTAIVSLSLLMFKCTSNPNGKVTLSYDRSVLCYESSTWRSMLGISVAAVVVYVVGLGTLFTRTVVRAPLPGYFETTSFQTRWAFLFVRYRPEAYWFSLSYLFKNVLVNLGYVLFSHPVWQIYSSFGVQMLHLLMVVVQRPYRSKVVYLVDIVVSASLLCVAPLLWSYAKNVDGHLFSETAVPWILIWSFLPLFVGAAAASWVTLQATLWKDKLREQLNTEFVEVNKAFSEFSSILWQDGVDFYDTIGDWDRTLFRDTARCIKVEVMGRSDKGRLSDRFLVERIKSRSLTSDLDKRSESGTWNLWDGRCWENDPEMVGTVVAA